MFPLICVQDVYIQERAEAMENIHSTIVELGSIFRQLAEMVKEQEEQVVRSVALSLLVQSTHDVIPVGLEELTCSFSLSPLTHTHNCYIELTAMLMRLRPTLKQHIQNCWSTSRGSHQTGGSWSRYLQLSLYSSSFSLSFWLNCGENYNTMNIIKSVSYTHLTLPTIYSV